MWSKQLLFIYSNCINVKIYLFFIFFTLSTFLYLIYYLIFSMLRRVLVNKHYRSLYCLTVDQSWSLYWAGAAGGCREVTYLIPAEAASHCYTLLGSVRKYVCCRLLFVIWSLQIYSSPSSQYVLMIIQNNIYTYVYNICRYF